MSPTPATIVRAVFATAALMSSTSALAVDNDAHFLIPAYSNPCCLGGLSQWPMLKTLGSTLHGSLGVIVTPTNGSLPSVDPNYVHSDGTGPLVDLVNTGASVIGYVAYETAGRAKRPLQDIKHDIDLYYTDSYWLNHHIRLKGIFFDLMSWDLGDVADYQILRDYIRNKDPNAWIVGNPGGSATTNTTGQTQYALLDYATVFDTLVVLEAAESDFRSNYTPPSWLNDVPASAISIIVHSTAASAQSMRTDLSLALERGAGWVYVTNDVPPNAYDTVPPYWSEEVALLSQLIFVSGFED